MVDGEKGKEEVEGAEESRNLKSEVGLGGVANVTVAPHNTVSIFGQIPQKVSDSIT
jgi:hypothetical protein